MRSEEDIRLIFGLKLKKLRTDQGLSLQQLSDKAGISVSYLNEIEKGKKYPKANKVADLARVLGISYDQLVSLKLQKTLTPVSQILNFELINSLPFETFGLDKKAIMNMVAEEPVKLSAFVNAIIEIARTYSLQLDHFYFTMLRSFQELHQNYFEEIEAAAAATRLQGAPADASAYQRVLEEQYHYQIQHTAFSNYPKLKSFRSVMVPGTRPLLLCNLKLTEQQRTFLFAREIGFSVLKLDKRPYTTSWLNVESFEHVLNNMKASYFAQCLQLPEKQFLGDLKMVFGKRKWNGDGLLGLMEKYNCSPEMLFQRMSNLLPRHFGAADLFFVRYSSREPEKHLKEVSKELHLTRQQGNLQYLFSEQSYRRWIAKCLLRFMQNRQQPDDRQTLVEAVIDRSENGNDYLVISILRPAPELSHRANSVTLGFMLTEGVKKHIGFLNDPFLHSKRLGELLHRDFEPPDETKRLQEMSMRMDEYNRLKSALESNKAL